MDISELQKEKEELEKAIFKLVYNFEMKTETSVSRIRYTRHEAILAGGSRVFGDFDVKVEVML